MALAPKLREEFLSYHTEFMDLSVPTKLQPYINPKFDTRAVMSGLDTWITEGIKYTWKDVGVNIDRYKYPSVAKRFPTAVDLVKKWGDDNPISSYSCIEPGNSIERHTGVENREGLYIRIHIPLIIPEGDVFFECEGVEIDWQDIWAFDNQLVHSAHNFSNSRRLIFMFDIRRERIGLPPGEPWDPHRQRTCPPFVRGKYPKVLHSCQR